MFKCNYCEDGGPVHEECLKYFNIFWGDRDEIIDLLGF